MGQLARCTPPNAVAQNLLDAAHLFGVASGFREPSNDFMRRMRQELTIVGETLSAYLLAGCKRVLCFGFDESTKLQARIYMYLPSPLPRLACSLIEPPPPHTLNL